MSRTPPSGRRHLGDEDGAAMVEFALVLPLLLLLLFGIIEWSFVFRDSLTVASATRAGARTASAMPRNATFADSTARAVATAIDALPDDAVQELWVYKAGPTGMPVGRTDFASCTSCVRYRWDGDADRFVRQSGATWDPTSQDACAGETDAVGIWLKVHHRFLTSFFGPDMDLTDHTVMNLEPIPILQGCR
jgi:Flp pilus assembly pilin Flp